MRVLPLEHTYMVYSEGAATLVVDQCSHGKRIVICLTALPQVWTPTHPDHLVLCRPDPRSRGPVQAGPHITWSCAGRTPDHVVLCRPDPTSCGPVQARPHITWSCAGRTPDHVVLCRADPRSRGPVQGGPRSRGPVQGGPHITWSFTSPSLRPDPGSAPPEHV